MSFVTRTKYATATTAMKSTTTAVDGCSSRRTSNGATAATAITMDLASSLTMETMESMEDDNTAVASKSLSLLHIAVTEIDDTTQFLNRDTSHQLPSSYSNDRDDIFRPQKSIDENDNDICSLSAGKRSVTNNDVALHCSSSLFPSSDERVSSGNNCMENISSPPIGASLASVSLDSMTTTRTLPAADSSMEMPSRTQKSVPGGLTAVDDDDGDEEQLNRFFHDNKDYIDYQQPMSPQQPPPPPPESGGTFHHHPSFRLHENHDHQQATKLRSLSESEVRVSPFWDMTTSSELQLQPSSPSNVLRHRIVTHNSSSDSTGKVVKMPAFRPEQQRSRAYTADTMTTLTAMNDTNCRHRTYSYNYNKADPHTDNGGEEGVWTSNCSDAENYSPPQSFHSSWDDADNPSSILLSSGDPSFPCRNTKKSRQLSLSSSSSSSGIIDGNAVPSFSIDERFDESEQQQEGVEWSLSMVPHQTPLVDTSHTTNHAENNNTTTTATSTTTNEMDQERLARMRWLRINRRFQLVVAVVVLIFSILLFAILVCWIVFAGTFVMAWNKSCDDVHLRLYFYLASLQLFLDIFRTEILRIMFRWNRHSNEAVPWRVVAYNIMYFIYALLVLRLGVTSVITPHETSEKPLTCRTTAPEFFQAGIAYVSMTLAAWATIIFGYILPFCIVAVLLTINGFNPNSLNVDSSTTGNASSFSFIPTAYATSGAPPGCVDKLQTIHLNHLSGSSDPKECCICLENFNDHDVIVKTMCHHVFHKSCCREWLRQSRTCPVCRDDIPSSLEHELTTSSTHHFGLRENHDPHQYRTRQALSSNHYDGHHHHEQQQQEASIPMGPSDRPVATLIRVLCDARNQLTESRSTATVTPINHNNAITSSRGSGISNTSGRSIADIERGV